MTEPLPPSDPVPLYLEATLPHRVFNLRNEADFAWLRDYFSGYHGVPGLHATLDAARPSDETGALDEHVRGFQEGVAAARRDIAAGLAANPAPAGLDVERLARAMDNAAMGPSHDFNVVMATTIAAEYAALATPTPEGTEGP